MKTDSEIERDVKAELGWNPDLKSTDIAISVKNGVVTLAGFVPRYIDKYPKRRRSEWPVYSRLQTTLRFVSRPLTKGQIPRLRVRWRRALKNQLPFSYEQIKAVVRDGWVTLEGDVEWQYQRQTAERAARPVKGVKALSTVNGGVKTGHWGGAKPDQFAAWA